MMKSYFMFTHPRAEVDLRTLKARNEWKGKYRHYRLLRQAANPVMELTPRQIMEWIELPIEHPWQPGTFENVRYIESQNLDRFGKFEIVPKVPPIGFRAWLARKLIKAARWLAPRDHGVLADSMEEAILDAAKYGTGIVKSARVDPIDAYDWSKDFDFLK